MYIKSLAKTGFESLFKAFSQAFADYEIQLNKQQLETMLNRRGYNPGLSFAAFENNEIIAFTLNGTGNYNGIPTAYDTGTGTLKEYRGRGLATRIFEYSLPFLKQANVKQYLLEVLQHNAKAVSVYKNLGFEVSREFNYYRQKNNAIINRFIIPGFQYSVERVDTKVCRSLSGFWDFYPSWQNSVESICRGSKDFISIGLYLEKKLVGYGIVEPDSGDITQLAVHKKHRRKGIGSILLKELILMNRNDSVKVINTDAACSSIDGFLKKKNINRAGKQYEMMRLI